MKKRILKLSAILSAICIMLTGCFFMKSKDKEFINRAREECNKSFSSICSFTFGDIKGKLGILKTENNHYTLSFISPETIKDIRFEIENDKVIISYKGIQKEISKDEIYSSSIIKIISSCLNQTQIGENITLQSKSDKIEISGKTDKYSFKLELNKDNMDILLLSVPEEGLELRFENFDLI